ETGLDWLDLTATRDVSYNDIEADVGGWISLGFRHATVPELCGLFGTYALAPSPCPGSTSQSGTRLVQTLQGFVGVTFSDDGRLIISDGLFDDGNVSDGMVGEGTLSSSPRSGSSDAGVFEDAWFADTVSQSGHWLVRPVPEPSTALLLA